MVFSVLSSPWPYANLEKGYDLVTGEQAPERIFRWVLHSWYVSREHDFLWPSVTRRRGMNAVFLAFVCVCAHVCATEHADEHPAELDGHTNATCTEVKLYPWALMWKNSPRCSPAKTSFKCFYCHFCYTSHSWWGHCGWHFSKSARHKGLIQYQPAVLFLKMFHNEVLLFMLFKNVFCVFALSFVEFFFFFFPLNRPGRADMMHYKHIQIKLFYEIKSLNYFTKIRLCGVL